MLTNEIRCKRHMATDKDCPRCPSIVESSKHVLRDCSFAMEVWAGLVPQVLSVVFFYEDRMGWLEKNLKVQAKFQLNVAWCGSRSDLEGS